MALDFMEQAEKEPHHIFFVIAHSHGGNVALRALNYISGEPSRINFATMGTPLANIGEPLFRGLGGNSIIRETGPWLSTLVFFSG